MKLPMIQKATTTFLYVRRRDNRHMEKKEESTQKLKKSVIMTLRHCSKKKMKLKKETTLTQGQFLKKKMKSAD